MSRDAHPILKLTHTAPRNPCEPGCDGSDLPSAPAARHVACPSPQQLRRSERLSPETRAAGLLAETVQLFLVPLCGACRMVYLLTDPNSRQQSCNSEFPLFYEPVAFKSCLISI